VEAWSTNRAILTDAGKKYMTRESWVRLDAASIEFVFNYLKYSTRLALDLP
jgi:hypothetical protein